MVVTPQAEAFNNWMQKVQDARQAIEQASLTWAELGGEDRKLAREAEQARKEDKEERGRPERFWKAVKEGKANLTEKLLSSEWKRWQPPAPLLKMTDDSGWTPLHWAAFRNHKDVCLVLLRGGADLLALDAGKQSALHVACFNGSSECSELLLDEAKKKKVLNNLRDAVNVFGCTPLLDAACNEHRELAASLVTAGVDLRAPKEGVFRTGSSEIARRFSGPEFHDH